MISHKMLCIIGACSLSVLFAAMATSQEAEQPPVEAPEHDELRALRDRAVAAFKERDIDTLLDCLLEDVVIVVQNAELLLGHQGVRNFHNAMSEGDDREVRSQESDFKVDELSTLYGEDTATAHGTIDDHFVLTNGLEFDLSSRWTATMVKRDDQWKVATFHVSTNMFDNGVMDQLMWWNSIKTGGITLLVGIVLAIAGMKMLGRKSVAVDHA